MNRIETTPQNRARRARSLVVLLAPVLFLFVAWGCHEPADYRTEVVGNGEGGVEIHRVPKDPSEMPQPSEESSGKSAIEQRVEVLEATVLRQQQEIANLRRDLNSARSATTSP